MKVEGFVTVDGVRKPATFELDTVQSDIPLRMAKGLWIPHDNEWTLMQVPEFDDPGGIRFAGRGIGHGKISGSSIRVGTATVQEESTLMQFKKDERTRNEPTIYSGEVTMHCRDGRAPGDGMLLTQRWWAGETYQPKAVIDHLVVNRVTLRNQEV